MGGLATPEPWILSCGQDPCPLKSTAEHRLLSSSPEEGRVRPKNGHFYKASRRQCPCPKTTKWNCCLTEWKKVSLPGLDPWALTYLEFHIYSLVTVRETETEQRDRERERRRVHTWP